MQLNYSPLCRKNKKVYIHVSSDKPRHESSGQESAVPSLLLLNCETSAWASDVRCFVRTGPKQRKRGRAEEMRVGRRKEMCRDCREIEKSGRNQCGSQRSDIHRCICMRKGERKRNQWVEVRTMKICAWILSCVALIVVYSAELQKYLETLRTLKCGRFPIPSLWKSPLLGICAAFTCF